MRGCHSCPPHHHSNIYQRKGGITETENKSEEHNTVTMTRDAAPQQREGGWGGEREREGEREERVRDECSSILRSEGKSPSVVVLLQRLALTHEYFILLMFKSHHL